MFRPSSAKVEEDLKEKDPLPFRHMMADHNKEKLVNI